jgi:hypothetical protein
MQNPVTMDLNIPTTFKKWSILYLLGLNASLGIPCFSKHRKQAMSTQEKADFQRSCLLTGCVENNPHKTVLKQGWKHLKIGLVCFGGVSLGSFFPFTHARQSLYH